MVNDSVATDAPVRPTQAGNEQRRRELELHLIQIRSEATVARLEARAAEIELLIRHLDGGRPPNDIARRIQTLIHDPSMVEVETRAKALLTHQQHSDRESIVLSSTETEPVPGGRKANTFNTWGEVLETLDVGPGVLSPNPESFDARLPAASEATSVAETKEHGSSPAIFSCAPDEMEFASISKQGPAEDACVAAEVELASHGPAVITKSKKRPASIVLSAFAHIVLLVVLATIGFHQAPQDQVAFTASVANRDAAPMQTFAIESIDPVVETEPTEARIDVSETSDITVSEVSLSPTMLSADSITAPFGEPMKASATAVSLADSATKVSEFCGVEGGGNHFVYLVDSSKSMGDGFETARQELLRSVAGLSSDQRFYVVFFDAESEFMTLGNNGQRESSSVYANEANKGALRRWAMQIQTDTGRAPYDSLRFALKLRPDVIFLLSDGEFPQGIEELLIKENRVENLFDDQRPISIVHTIGYHSRQGEVRMRRIAQQNAGQYRHIPAP